MPSVLQHRVRYHETDAQGFMFNSRYLELADVAMTEYFRKLDIPLDQAVEGGADPSVVRANLQFMRPAKYDDLLDVEVRCTQVGRSSFHLDMHVSRTHQHLTTIHIVYVNVDIATEVAAPLPSAALTALSNCLAPSAGAGLEPCCSCSPGPPTNTRTAEAC